MLGMTIAYTWNGISSVFDSEPRLVRVLVNDSMECAGVPFRTFALVNLQDEIKHWLVLK